MTWFRYNFFVMCVRMCVHVYVSTHVYSGGVPYPLDIFMHARDQTDPHACKEITLLSYRSDNFLTIDL